MNDIINEYNELIRHNNSSTENFIHSLQHSDVALIFSKFLNKLRRENISFKLIKSFDYENDDTFDCIEIECNEEDLETNNIDLIKEYVSIEKNKEDNLVIRFKE